MQLNRKLENLLTTLFRQNRIVGGLYSSLGQEAISVGTTYALEKRDWIAPMIRNIGAVLVRGFRPRDILMQYMAKADSPTGGKDGTAHFGDLVERRVVSPISMLGDLIPVMAGVGMAARYLGRDEVALTWIGEGGSSTGVFHEGLNFAAGHPRESYEAEGINVFFGAPKFLDAHRISLDGRTISSNKFIVCTGSSPVIPPIQGLDRIPYLTNETIFNLQTLPKSMLVLGAGPIGIELAAAMNRLGVDVTVLLRSQQILKKDDRELVDRLAQILRAEGVKIRTGTRTKTFTRVNGKVLVDVEDQQGRHQIETDRVLIAVGRKPNIDDLALEKAGVEFDKEGIKVDKRLTTTAPTIYACGDVVPPYLFTHVAEYEAVVAATNACLPVPIRKTNYENVLWCTYTDPELAHAGLTEQQARELYGDKIKIYRWEHKDVDRARTDLAENGLSKFICDKKGKLLGVHILGHGAAELMHEAQLAKSLHLPFSKIASVIHAYPSYSDAVRQPAKRCYIDVLQDNFFLKLLRALTSRKNRKRITIGLIAVLLILLFLMSGAGSWVGQVAKEFLGQRPRNSGAIEGRELEISRNGE